VGRRLRPRFALSALLSKLRRVLGEAIEGRDEVTVRLPPDAQIDLESARNGLHRAESMLHAGRWWEAYGPAVTARYISQRQFMRGESAPWIEEIRRDLEETHLRALECNAKLGLALGGAEAPVAGESARRLIALAPYRESGYRLLMEALEREGNVAEAMRGCEQLRHLLREELGTTPCGDVQRVYDRLLART
jgi:DNA-binding SARP family transcriptional activator